jgi:hypothetical protein
MLKTDDDWLDAANACLFLMLIYTVRMLINEAAARGFKQHLAAHATEKL